jgi:hypothetical protein
MSRMAEPAPNNGISGRAITELLINHGLCAPLMPGVGRFTNFAPSREMTS